jgi:beta-phosphoglucomutase-like phosphatase (HAD superfamily)
MKLKALIFDVDGTLADTEEVHRCAFNEAFSQLGLDWNWSRPKYAHLLMTTGGKERLIAYIDSLQLSPLDHQTLINRVGIIHGIKTNIYTRMVLAGQAPLRDGIARLIDEARRAKILLAIASTTTYANIDALLRTNLGSGALEQFAAIGAGDVVKHKKPSPDIYEFILKQLCLSADECVAVEDSANGLEAAKGAGLYTVITPSYWTRTEDFSSADLVLPSLGSTDRPLTPRAVALVGHPVLGIREIDRQLNAIRECG